MLFVRSFFYAQNTNGVDFCRIYLLTETGSSF
nr:MAG TPA: hypothetical protein [Caudoviricetes sp.]